MPLKCRKICVSGAFSIDKIKRKENQKEQKKNKIKERENPIQTRKETGWRNR